MVICTHLSTHDKIFQYIWIKYADKIFPDKIYGTKFSWAIYLQIKIFLAQIMPGQNIPTKNIYP